MQWLLKGGKYSGNEKMVEIKRKIAKSPRIMRLLATSIDVAIKLSATNTNIRTRTSEHEQQNTNSRTRTSEHEHQNTNIRTRTAEHEQQNRNIRTRTAKTSKRRVKL